MAGIPAMAAPYFRAASITSWMISVVTKGRTASWTRTISSAAATAHRIGDRLLAMLAAFHKFDFLTGSSLSAFKRARKPAISLARSAT